MTDDATPWEPPVAGTEAEHLVGALDRPRATFRRNADTDDREFTSTADDTPEQLYALWDAAVGRSRARLDAALAGGGLDRLVHPSWPDGRTGR